MDTVSLASVIESLKSGGQSDDIDFSSITDFATQTLMPKEEHDLFVLNDTLKEILSVIKKIEVSVTIVNPVTKLKTGSKKEDNSSVTKVKTSSNIENTQVVKTPSILSVTKGLLLNAVPTSVFSAYANGINKLISAIKTIDTSDIDKKLSTLSEVSDTVNDIGNISWIKITIGSFKLKKVASSYASGIDALVTALGKIRVSKTLEDKIDIFSHILDPLKTLQDLKLKSILTSVLFLRPISAGIVSGITPLLKLTKPMLTKLEGVGKGLKAVFEPITALLNSVTTSLIKGGVGLILIAGSLAVAAYSLNKFADVSWESIGKGLLGLGALTIAAVVLGKQTGSVIKGALGIALLGASILPLAYSLEKLKDIGIGTIGVLAAGLITLGVAGAALGTTLPLMAAGATAIALLGASIIPFAYSMNLLQKIDWDNIGKAGDAILSLAMGALPLVLAVPGLVAGGIGLGLFAGGVKLLKMAIGDNDSGKAISTFVDGLTNLTENVSGDKLWDIAKGLGVLSAAIIAIGAGQAVSGIASLFGKLVGGGTSPIDQLIRLAKEGSALIGIGDGLRKIADGLKAMSEASAGLIDLQNLDLKKLEDVARFQKAVEAGYTSWKDYEDHNFKWRGKETAENLQPVPPTTGSDLNAQGSINTGSRGTSIYVNNGGNTTVSSNSSNVNTSNSLLMPALQGSSLSALYAD